MPKEFDDMVAALKKEGYPEDSAYAIATAVYKKKYGKTPKEGTESTKSLGFLLRQYKADKNYWVEGYGAVAGVIDEGNDIILKEALEKSLARGDLKEGGYDNMFTFHNNEKLPVGKIADRKVVDLGDGVSALWLKARMNKHLDNFKEIWGSINDGFLNGQSIGYKVLDSEEVDIPHFGKVRVLKDIQMYEVSFTPEPMNLDAKVLEFYVKSRNGKTTTPMDEGVMRSTYGRNRDIIAKRIFDKKFNDLTDEQKWTVHVEATKAEPTGKVGEETNDNNFHIKNNEVETMSKEEKDAEKSADERIESLEKSIGALEKALKEGGMEAGDGATPTDDENTKPSGGKPDKMTEAPPKKAEKSADERIESLEKAIDGLDKMIKEQATKDKDDKYEPDDEDEDEDSKKVKKLEAKVAGMTKEFKRLQKIDIEIVSEDKRGAVSQKDKEVKVKNPAGEEKEIDRWTRGSELAEKHKIYGEIDPRLS